MQYNENEQMKNYLSRFDKMKNSLRTPNINLEKEIQKNIEK